MEQGEDSAPLAGLRRSTPACGGAGGRLAL